MRHTSKNCVYAGQAKKRAIALTFLICLIIVSLLSGVFILIHAGHTHDRNGTGGACMICIQIRNAENLLKKLHAASLSAVFVIAALFSVYTISNVDQSFIPPLTPIKLKIRMNN